MKLADAVVLVTGANRGIGLAFAQEALARGARKVYAGARDVSRVRLDGVVPVVLDVTDEASVAAAAGACSDVTIVVNNAGIASTGGFLADAAVADARRMLETNYFGLLWMARAFAPLLATHGGGAIVNMLSVASWMSRPVLGVYGSSKAAAWSLTNGLRNDLRAQGTQVLGVHVGLVDTDLTRGFDADKVAPSLVASMTYDALEAGASEVLVDERTRVVHRGLSDEPAIYLLPPAA